MSDLSNAIWSGVAGGIYNTARIAFGGLTSYGLLNRRIDPFDTLYPNLDSPSGFSFWAHPAYATPTNVRLSSSGYDTTFAPYASSLGGLGYGSSLLSGGLFNNGLLGGGLLGNGLLYEGGLLGGGLFGGTSLFSRGLYSGGLFSGGLYSGGLFNNYYPSVSANANVQITTTSIDSPSHHHFHRYC